MLLLRVASKMIEWPAYCCVGWLAISSPADRQIERERGGEECMNWSVYSPWLCYWGKEGRKCISRICLSHSVMQKKGGPKGDWLQWVVVTLLDTKVYRCNARPSSIHNRRAFKRRRKGGLRRGNAFQVVVVVVPRGFSTSFCCSAICEFGCRVHWFLHFPIRIPPAEW